MKADKKDLKSLVGMTLDEVFEYVTFVLPNATIEEDNDGQLVIYTGVKLNKAGVTREMP